MTEVKFRRTTCCKALKCFLHVNFDHYKERARYIFSISSHGRRAYLQSILNSNGAYFFDGREVCNRFLKQGLHFSSDLLSKQRDTPYFAVAPLAVTPFHQTQSATVSNRTSNMVSSSSSGMVQDNAPSLQRETVVSFLRRLSEDCSDKMPDCDELHLPFFKKHEVYSLFVVEFRKLYLSREPPSSQYFLRCWKQHCRNIKVRKSSRFTVCEECERLRAALNSAVKEGRPTADLKRQRNVHIDYVTAERMCYQLKRDRARLQDSDFCSIIVDGADQSAFGIPHFTTCTKNQRGNALKVKLVGLLEHCIENELLLYTMTEEQQTGANHIIEAIHRFLNAKRAKGCLPPSLFVQLDNCSRENKNHFFMSYMEFLVSARVFDVVECGFLPVGHTHEDIDQAFSQTSTRLRSNNAITLQDLHAQLQHANRGHTCVHHMKRIINWSGLCTSSNCFRRVDNITQYQYFKFCRPDMQSGHTTCFVRKSSAESWIPLFPNVRNVNGATAAGGILKFRPRLDEIPDLSIDCPSGVERITTRFVSEEGRINDTDKMIQLYELRDFVFSSRIDKPHWNLEQIVETEHTSSLSAPTSFTEIDVSTPSANLSSTNDAIHTVPRTVATPENTNNDVDVPVPAPSPPEVEQPPPYNAPVTTAEAPVAAEPHPFTKQTYDVGSFVLVKPESSASDNERFWVGKVVAVVTKPGETFARHLRVHWYDNDAREKRTDLAQSKFFPYYNEAPSKKRKLYRTNAVPRSDLRDPWIDLVDTDSVLVAFPALTRRHTLPLSAKKKIPT